VIAGYLTASPAMPGFSTHPRTCAKGAHPKQRRESWLYQLFPARNDAQVRVPSLVVFSTAAMAADSVRGVPYQAESRLLLRHQDWQRRKPARRIHTQAETGDHPARGVGENDDPTIGRRFREIVGQRESAVTEGRQINCMDP
jgi:hypothetical protein